MDFLDFVRALQRPNEDIPETTERVQSLYRVLQRNSPRLWLTIVNCGRQKRQNETLARECSVDLLTAAIGQELRRERQRAQREQELIQRQEEFGQLFGAPPKRRRAYNGHAG